MKQSWVSQSIATVCFVSCVASKQKKKINSSKINSLIMTIS